MTNSVFLADLPWPAFAAHVEAGAPVILPVGATEQHGHHMAMNVDVTLPTAIAERVALRTGALVAPTIPYGNRSQPRSGGGRSFPGTLNLQAATHAAIIRDLICELHRHGVRRIVMLNGHYENIWTSVEGIELALDATGRGDGLTILRMDHWDLVRRETIDRIFPQGYPGIELEHASVIETSMMMALRPELVDLTAALHDGPARFRPYDRYPAPPDELPPSGVLSMTEGSSAEKGNWLLDDIVDAIERAMRHEFELE